LSKWKIHLDRAEILRWPKQQIDLERQLRRAQVGDVWDVEEPLIQLLNTKPPEEGIILEALVPGFMKNDRLIDVMALTTTWSKQYPTDWLPLIYRGNAQLRLYGKSNKAAKDFERVLELKPNDPDAHLALALVLTHQGEVKDALPHYQFCLASQPDDPTEALFGLASCQYSMGQTEEARASLVQLFAKNKDHPAGCFLQGKVELAEGRQEEALKWLQKADALSPDESDVTNVLLHVCRQLDRQQDVARYSRRLDEIHLRDDKLSYLLTEVKTQPNDPEIRFQLGMICLERGHDQEASHWFQSILWKDSNHLPTLNVLANYYQKKGKPKMADYYRGKAEKASGIAKSKSPEK
jgi:tetratricopeptide (TPR) repeat protein